MRCAVLFSGMATLGGGLGSLHFAVVRHSSQNAPLTHLFNLHYSKSCARRGFVLRACIRRADEVRVEATLVDGPADTTFFRRRTSELTITTDRWFLSVCYRKAMCRNTEPSCRL